MNRAEAKAARIARRRPTAKTLARPDFSGLPIGRGTEISRDEAASAVKHSAHRRTFRGIYSTPTRQVLADIGAQRRRAGR